MSANNNISFLAQKPALRPILSEKDRSLMCSLAATLIQAGNTKAGMNVAAYVYELWPTDPQVLNVTAHAHLAQGNHTAVVALLAPGLLTGRLRKPQLWMMLAVACLNTMQHAKAFDAARKYLKMFR